ncbi:hypothetical protein HPB47_018615 [Ixodes persulcatus]|uniref:Uncharacterized protein n=1 Tax=Ixodes persulcatus TaxID=34615 RepID=A0AC60QK99_IXOPE|nr:hypothetical protein HPB47_018615 [Ixodes persulcatus]
MKKMMETVNKVFENVHPTIIQMSTTLNAKIDRMGETLNAQMGKMGEVIPQKKTVQSLFILNVYNPPSDNLRDLDKFLREVKKVPKGQKLLVVGGFNAPHVACGYHKTNKKGTDVHNAAQHHQLTLWNDPQCTTRIGNSISRDTSPELTLSKGIQQIE